MAEGRFRPFPPETDAIILRERQEACRIDAGQEDGAMNRYGRTGLRVLGGLLALVLAAMYGFISQKPVTVAAVLLLCFPITYILPIVVAAFISAKCSLAFNKWWKARVQ